MSSPAVFMCSCCRVHTRMDSRDRHADTGMQEQEQLQAGTCAYSSKCLTKVLRLMKVGEVTWRHPCQLRWQPLQAAGHKQQGTAMTCMHACPVPQDKPCACSRTPCNTTHNADRRLWSGTLLCPQMC